MRFFVMMISLTLICGCGSETSNEGDALFAEGKFTEAIEAYNSVLQVNPQHVRSLYNRGRCYEEMENFEQAEKDYKETLEIDNKNVVAYLSLAKILYEQKKYNKSLIYSGNAIELNENSAKAHFLAARAKHQLGYYDQAMESYGHAIAINKEYGQAYLYRGALKVGRKKMQGACDDFNKARLLDVEGSLEVVEKYCPKK